VKLSRLFKFPWKWSKSSFNSSKYYYPATLDSPFPRPGKHQNTHPVPQYPHTPNRLFVDSPHLSQVNNRPFFHSHSPSQPLPNAPSKGDSQTNLRPYTSSSHTSTSNAMQYFQYIHQAWNHACPLLLLMVQAWLSTVIAYIICIYLLNECFGPIY
jgi:hypothetical protein